MQPHLTEWVKSMIGSEQAVETVDSKLEEKPSSKQLKRMLLVALRCVDPDINHRPTMAQILLMLEPRDLLLADVGNFKCKLIHIGIHFILIQTYTIQTYTIHAYIKDKTKNKIEGIERERN